MLPLATLDFLPDGTNDYFFTFTPSDDALPNTRLEMVGNEDMNLVNNLGSIFYFAFGNLFFLMLLPLTELSDRPSFLKIREWFGKWNQF